MGRAAKLGKINEVIFVLYKCTFMIDQTSYVINTL